MIDTNLIRANLQAGHMHNTSIYSSTHYDGCENNHLPCAIFALCDELDEARAEIERLQKRLCQYDAYTRTIDEVTR